MTIHNFDIHKGIYSFEFSELDTEIHAHPVVEIIIATKDSFTLKVDQHVSENVVFAIIDANCKHQLFSKNCEVSILMIESNNLQLTEFLEQSGIKMSKGYFSKKVVKESKHIFQEIKQFSQNNDLKTSTDTRVQQCISIIENEDVEYSTLINSLTSNIFLSESRISHLFKEHIGVSLKKYLVWSNLKKAIQSYLQEENNLTEASLQHGFFDQAHLSNAFKNVLGVRPSKAYNSRTIQF